MSKKPFISIILPIYKVEKYLERCVNSIVEQGFSDYEIILVDDGSPDNCPSLCDNLANNNSKIKVIHKKNGGLGFARNSGLNIACGEYIWFVDSDDSVVNNSLSTIKNAIIENDKPDVVFFGFNRIDKKLRCSYVEIQNPKKKKYISNKEIIGNLLPNFIFTDPDYKENITLCNSVWCCCFKNEVLKKYSIQFVSEREFISEDYYFWIENFKYFNSIYFIHSALYNYHQNEDSLSLRYMDDRYKKNVIMLSKLKEIILENYSKECITRLYGMFISNVMGCLKSELSYRKKVGIRNNYLKFKSICLDNNLLDAVNIYNCGNRSIGWRIFSFCIRKKLYILLYLFFSLKNRM